MADKRLNDLSTATDGAYVYAEDANGNQIKISKADLATVVAVIMGNPIVYRGLIDDTHDLNNINDGIYYTNGSYNPTNTPTGEYNNIVFQLSNPQRGDKVQILFGFNSTKILRRFFNYTETWLDWREL